MVEVDRQIRQVTFSNFSGNNPVPEPHQAESPNAQDEQSLPVKGKSEWQGFYFKIPGTGRCGKTGRLLNQNYVGVVYVFTWPIFF